MRIYKLPEGTPASLPDAPLSLALGNFDGVHIGHRQLLDESRRLAANIPHCRSGVWTFSAPAKEEPAVPILTTQEEKLIRFAEAGLDYAIFEDFEAVRTLPAASFIHDILIAKLHCAAAVCGFNFRFGFGRTGDADCLSDVLSAQHIPLSIVPPVLYKSRIVSSTRIRSAVISGDMEEAAGMLGRPFSICFPVIYGNQLGRTIGLPTINQDFPAGHIIPRHGIYACLCTVGDKRYEGVANVGIRPTVPGDEHVNCETHIIDYNGFLYGKSIRVEFCHRLRDEMRFPSLDALRNAIRLDIEHTRDYFRNTRVRPINPDIPPEHTEKKENACETLL